MTPHRTYSAAIAQHACEYRGVGLLPVLQGAPAVDPSMVRPTLLAASIHAGAAEEGAVAGGGRSNDAAETLKKSVFFLDEFVLHRGVVAALHQCVVDALAPGFGRPMAGNCLCVLSNSRQSGRCFQVQQGGKRVVRENLFNLAARHARSVLEVGFNAGHSAALFCFAWTSGLQAAHDDATGERSGQFHYCGFDICEHSYTLPCFAALQAKYSSEVRMELVEGDSTVTMRPPSEDGGDIPAKGGFDMIHIDGCHTPSVARADILNASRFAAGPRLLLFDDATMHGLPEVLDELRSAGVLADVAPGELDGFTPTKLHRLFRYL